MNGPKAFFAIVMAIFHQTAVATEAGFAGAAYTVFPTSLVTYFGNSRRSSVLYLNGYDSNRVEKASAIFIGFRELTLPEGIDPNRDFTVSEDEEGNCWYTAHVFANGNDDSPVVGNFKDDCTIRNAPLARTTYADRKNYTTFYPGGSLTYTDVNFIMTGNLDISYYDRLPTSKLKPVVISVKWK